MGEPIIISHLMRAPIEDVWTAITDPVAMKKWYFAQLKDFRAEPGFRTEFKVKNGGRKFTHIWEVTEVIPPRRISYLWAYKEWKGLGLVTFNLEAHGRFTCLTLTSAGGHSFKAPIPEFNRDSGVEGWTYLICESLPAYLAGQ